MSKATISRAIATAHDVAAYILDKQDNGLPAMKLQKRYDSLLLHMIEIYLHL